MFIRKSTHDAKVKALYAEIAQTGVMLTDTTNALGAEIMQHSYTRQERDAARIERDTAQRERDGYRGDALKYRANNARLKAANDRRHEDALQRATQPKPKPTNGAHATEQARA